MLEPAIEGERLGRAGGEDRDERSDEGAASGGCNDACDLPRNSFLNNF